MKTYLHCYPADLLNPLHTGMKKDIQSQFIRNDGKQISIMEVNIINGVWMRLLADHSQIVNVCLEEVQSPAETNSDVIEKNASHRESRLCSALIFFISLYIGRVGAMPHISMRTCFVLCTPTAPSARLKHPVIDAKPEMCLF